MFMNAAHHNARRLVGLVPMYLRISATRTKRSMLAGRTLGIGGLNSATTGATGTIAGIVIGSELAVAVASSPLETAGASLAASVFLSAVASETGAFCSATPSF